MRSDRDNRRISAKPDATATRLNAVATLWLALILLLLSATSISRNALYADRVAIWRDTARKSPNGERPHYNLGTELKDIGQLEEARLEWERTVALNPRHSQALNQLGNVWYLGKQYEKAERYYLAAVQADLNNIEACYNLAMTLEIRGNTTQALQYYRQFLRSATPEYRDLVPAVSRKVEKLAGAVRQ
jgi:tetratricopeptide (TPR) repeat protein